MNWILNLDQDSKDPKDSKDDSNEDDGQSSFDELSELSNSGTPSEIIQKNLNEENEAGNPYQACSLS